MGFCIGSSFVGDVRLQVTRERQGRVRQLSLVCDLAARSPASTRDIRLRI
jgi:hypothetical protein